MAVVCLIDYTHLQQCVLELGDSYVASLTTRDDQQATAVLCSGFYASDSNTEYVPYMRNAATR